MLYPKILTLGSVYTERALEGAVSIQEKVDGSFFMFGINENKEFIICSHGKGKHRQIDINNVDKIFKPAVNHILSKRDYIINIFNTNTYFFCETLCKNKHNILNYGKIPQNNIVLFDCLINGNYAHRLSLKVYAKDLDIDCVPELFSGIITKEELDKFLETESYLGGGKIEGIVIKNYNENIVVWGQVIPLFTKYVSKRFKERHQIEWKNTKSNIQDYLKGFKTEARWEKAYLYLRDNGLLKNDFSDIGGLIRRVNEDIKEEETENIKKELYNYYIKDILREATKQLPEWYKEKLVVEVNNNDS